MTWRPRRRWPRPASFWALSHGDLDDSLRVLHDHLRRIMSPVTKEFPLVAYDIWGTEDKGVEEALLAEIPFAADLGVDVLYIDAGWYEGSCRNGSGDWMTGVGNYASEDRVKFPGGLAMISKKVHAAGMKFGLWFAPRVVDSRLVGKVIPPDFVAQHDGKDIALHYSYWAPITQICPGDPKVVEHLKKMIGDAVERYDLDWVKYDNSGVTECMQPHRSRSSGRGRGLGSLARPVRNLEIPAPAIPETDDGGLRYRLRLGTHGNVPLGVRRPQQRGRGSPQRDRRQLRLSGGALWSLCPGKRGRERPGRPGYRDPQPDDRRHVDLCAPITGESAIASRCVRRT